MAETLATLDKVLDWMIEDIMEAVVAPTDGPMSKLFQRVPRSRVYGRGLKAYFPMVVDNAGAYGRMDEEGEFPASKTTTNVEASLGVVKQALTFRMTDEALQAMKGGRQGLKTSLDEIINGGLRTHKAREEYMYFGRGDGAVARVANTNYVTSTSQYTATTPIRGVEGDQLIWFHKRGAVTVLANQTAHYITNVDHENGTFDVSTSPSRTIVARSIAYLKGTPTAGTIGTDYMYGMEAWFDRQTGYTVQWDSNDSATKRNVQTYMGLNRSTYAKMRCQVYDAGTAAALSIANMAVGPSMVYSKGVPWSDMIAACHFKMFRRMQVLFSGANQIRNGMVELPLGRSELPIVSMAGTNGLPIIQSYYIPDGFIACFDKNDFVRLVIDPEWVTSGGGSKWHLIPGTTEFKDMRSAYFRWYGNLAAKRPYRHCVTKDLSTS